MAEQENTIINKIQSIIHNIISNNIDKNDICWVELRQTLETNFNSIPIIRSPKIICLLEQGLSTFINGFKELVFEQLSKQMKHKGANEFICSLPFLSQIVFAVSDSNILINEYVENILSKIGLHLFKHYSSELKEISQSSDENYIKVYSLLFKSIIENNQLIDELSIWISDFHNKMKLNELSDVLVILNLIEIENQFTNSMIKSNSDIRIKLWNYLEPYINDTMNVLLSNVEVPCLNFILGPLLLFIGQSLKLYITLLHEGNLSIEEDFELDKEFLNLLEKYIENTNESVQESIILGLGHYSFVKSLQNEFFNRKKLLRFYKDSLYKSKTHYLSFIHSITVALEECKGNDIGKDFCNIVIENNERMGTILSYAKTPYIKERSVIYRFFEQLAAVEYGRNYLYFTNGLLVWLTDRNLIIDLHLESNWRYSLLKQLVSNKSQCREKLGDSGYLRIQEYISDGIFHSQNVRVAVKDEVR